MKNNSAWFVFCIGITFLVISICRLFGFTVSSIVIAFISVFAALISLSDLLSITKYNKSTIVVRVIAFLLFIVLLVVWLLGIKSKLPVIQIIGDSFTILGLGIVIMLYAIKEILYSKRVNKIENDSENENPKIDIELYKFILIENEYEEMMKMNDIIERLKNIDKKTLSFNRVHNGWASFSDFLADHWNNWKGPFFDGKHREIYFDFLIFLDETAEKIGDIADTDPRYFKETSVEMWGETIDITIQPRINNPHIMSITEVIDRIQQTLDKWEEVKGIISTRYQKERAEQINK
ncbi:DNA-binding ferritin-like protein [Solibacillus silvestris StLB046]|uniref:DNA-binding ferritin-like protein n=1 Tax=Solibacillus silvestris (strain StLB046) TaxID=1002809 RepID=F2F0D2_SOLSS|nr:APC family permease [Solibacillus silvestris]BAK15242.1 DNA-binding ferritin-like protein [Solibacillus silvestris StLB046]